MSALLIAAALAWPPLALVSASVVGRALRESNRRAGL